MFADYKGCLKHLASDDSQIMIAGEEAIFNGLVSPFKTDTVKILGSKALSRLARKTQVFLSRKNPHTRTRERHSHEVLQTAIMIAEMLGLNTDLAMAGAIGHDIGHLPFGHDGEIALSEILGREIRHAAVGVQIATEVERSGEGLGLTPPTLEAIQNHSCAYTSLCCDSTTPESAVVMIADKISYIFADVNDIERCMGSNDNIMRVKRRAEEFGANQRQRVTTCIEALVQESAEKGFVSFSDSDCAIQFAKFRKYMFENIYFPKGPSRRIVIEGLKKAFELLRTCIDFKFCDPALLLVLLTDDEAWQLIEIAMDSQTLNIEQIPNFGICEIYKNIEGVGIYGY